ncbi:MAG: hypothetical protein GY758_33900, partial [Fuerstiella sp.]|nr:hypothetical protein [Fuerstiella sp.]
FELADLAAARSAAAVRISWPAIFLKAYGLIAAEVPELRQTWHRWPVAHLYQHPQSVGALAVQRQYRGEPWLFWAQIPEPESLSLAEIQRRIDEFQTGDVRKLFRKQLKLAQLPTPARRLIWAWNLHAEKSRRACRLGTFFLSSLSGQGTEIQIPPSIHTGCLTYGPVDCSGDVRVTLAYDHRVMDGDCVARCLARLESTLCETLRLEVLKPGTTHTNIRAAA